MIRKTAIFILLFCGIALAQGDADQPFYTVSLARRGEHIVHVALRIPKTAAGKNDLILPVWNALYQVRDFSQYVLRFAAHDDAGKEIPVRTVNATEWEVASSGPFVFEYDIVANSPGPFGAQLNDQHAFFNLAEMLVYDPALRTSPVLLGLSDIPGGWKVATALPEQGAFGGNHPIPTFPAANYDQLVDSPVEVGTFAERDFDAVARYRVVVDADPSDYDMDAIADQARKLATTEVEWMGERPFDHYVFIYHFPRVPSGGGMEHAYSTAIDVTAQRVKQDPRSVAGVTAHEFFHLWNLKRIRPQSLEPVDYTQAQPSRALWWSEGVTSTVGDLMMVRAGYWNEKQYLTGLARQIDELESRPAHLTQSAEDSSLETWYDKYPFYGQPERSISYYNKGEILGVLLDLSVREATANKKSLRDVFHWLNDHYAKQGKFFPDSAGIEQASEAVCNCALQPFFKNYVSGVAPLPYDQVFNAVGLRVVKSSMTVADPGFRIGRTFGRARGVPQVVSEVESGSPAQSAGLREGDTITQVNGTALSRPADMMLDDMKPGDEVRLTVSGAAGEHTLSFKLGGRTEEHYSIADVDNVTEAQRALRAHWIHGD